MLLGLEIYRQVNRIGKEQITFPMLGRIAKIRPGEKAEIINRLLEMRIG
jgi:hypothetical protein